MCFLRNKTSSKDVVPLCGRGLRCSSLSLILEGMSSMPLTNGSLKSLPMSQAPESCRTYLLRCEMHVSYQSLECANHLLFILPDRHGVFDVTDQYNGLWDVQNVHIIQTMI